MLVKERRPSGSTDSRRRSSRYKPPCEMRDPKCVIPALAGSSDRSSLDASLDASVHRLHAGGQSPPAFKFKLGHVCSIIVFRLVVPLVLLATLLPACRPSGPSARPTPPGGPPPASLHAPADTAHLPGRGTRAVFPLPLTGPLARADAEISGLAWHGSDLLLLPQHPFRLSQSSEHGMLFALPKDDIEGFLEGQHEKPLRPRPVIFLAPGLGERMPAYDGFEALSFHKNHAYLTIEAVANPETEAMRGFLLKGRLHGDTLRLNTRRRAALPPQTETSNMAYEALLTPAEGLARGRVVAFYEANGRNVNPRPKASVFSPQLQPLRRLTFPPLEYRLTDATALDSSGRFWAMNYFFPGEHDALHPAPDPLGVPTPAPAHERPVERLVEFHLSTEGFQRTSAPPLRLSLLPGTPRNWEGLARYESDARGPGFLLATDQYPETILGFVAVEP